LRWWAHTTMLSYLVETVLWIPCPFRPQAAILLISASQVARITGMCHCFLTLSGQYHHTEDQAYSTQTFGGFTKTMCNS
jgi:hypothetical protein